MTFRRGCWWMEWIDARSCSRTRWDTVTLTCFLGERTCVVILTTGVVSLVVVRRIPNIDLEGIAIDSSLSPASVLVDWSMRMDGVWLSAVRRRWDERGFGELYVYSRDKSEGIGFMAFSGWTETRDWFAAVRFSVIPLAGSSSSSSGTVSTWINALRCGWLSSIRQSVLVGASENADIVENKRAASDSYLRQSGSVLMLQ